ncbi:MAG: ATP-dependent Clp protease proteolytic subunit [Anaerolineaceae bacterium]|nr:ATP-dependent Clp protease proteolytic subunit [Anaerolineaceae bacterium]
MRTVVWGAPCSGKSSYVSENAKSGDVVHDFDRLYSAVSGLPLYERNEALSPYVWDLTDEVYQGIEDHSELDAWIINSSVDKSKAEDLAKRFDAELVVLEVSREETHKRCNEDGRPEEWHDVIDEWFDAQTEALKSENRMENRLMPGKSKKGKELKVLNAAQSESGQNEIWLYGDIVDDANYEFYVAWNGEGTAISPRMIREKLKDFSGSDVTIRIHSQGGFVDDASAMRAIISDYPGKVTCKVDGLCASAAMMLAISGDKVVMQDSAYLMIHNPWTRASGDVDELKKTIRMLQATKEGIIQAYMSKSNLSHDKLDKMMTDESWITADEALEFGFVDAVESAQKVKASNYQGMAAMNSLRQFKNMPDAVKAMLGIDKENDPAGEEEISTSEPVDSEITSLSSSLETMGNEEGEDERSEAIKNLRNRVSKILEEEK